MIKPRLVYYMSLIERLDCDSCGWALMIHRWRDPDIPSPSKHCGGFRLGPLSIAQTEAIDKVFNHPDLTKTYVHEWVAFLKRLFRTPHKVCDDYD